MDRDLTHEEAMSLLKNNEHRDNPVDKDFDPAILIDGEWYRMGRCDRSGQVYSGLGGFRFDDYVRYMKDYRGARIYRFGFYVIDSLTDG